MKSLAFLLGLFCLLPQSAYCEVTLTCDFSNSRNRREPIHNFWSVRNEIPPYPRVGSQQPPKDNTMNLIRLLGGWAKDGKMQPEEDCCYWDEAKQKYVYRLSKLTDRIDGVRSQGYRIHQLVLDNPPWCFQRGLKFGNNKQAGEYPANDRVSTYGNSLPPGDPEAWHAFIKAAMTKLVETYGLKQVNQWRFRIGTESDYHPHHWAGSKQDYFNHYRNTAKAVLAVLPDAKLGAHFLGAGGEGRYGPEFVTWCHRNKLKLDFVGVSFYPTYNKPRQVDLYRVYDKDLKPFVDALGWKAQLDIPEHSLFTEPAPKIGIAVETSHWAAFHIWMAQMVYEAKIGQVHSWGDKTKSIPNLALGTMVGKDRYQGQKSGQPETPMNQIDGIFAATDDGTVFDALIYNFNPDPAYINDETVRLVFSVPGSKGSRYAYRILTYDQENNAHYQFVKKYPLAGKRVNEGGWITNRVKNDSKQPTDNNGAFDRILEGRAKSLWKNEKDTLKLKYIPNWSKVEFMTTASGTRRNSSKLTLEVKLSSFSFKKIEFRQVASKPR